MGHQPWTGAMVLLPALARINNIDFKSIKIEETAPPLQPAALLAKKADFITMFRASNDKVQPNSNRSLSRSFSRFQTGWTKTQTGDDAKHDQQEGCLKLRQVGEFHDFLLDEFLRHC